MSSHMQRYLLCPNVKLRFITLKDDEISETESCMWYTFVPEDDFCNLLLTCTEINDDTCGSCVSGMYVVIINKIVVLVGTFHVSQ